MTTVHGHVISAVRGFQTNNITTQGIVYIAVQGWKENRMTKDEAIIELGYAKDFQTPKRKEALDMAIESLTERKGKWITTEVSGKDYTNEEFQTYIHECSRCGCVEFLRTKFCPHCGAKMGVEE